MAEKDRRNPLAGFHRELPMVLEGIEHMLEFVTGGRERSMGALNLVVQSLPPKVKMS